MLRWVFRAAPCYQEQENQGTEDFHFIVLMLKIIPQYIPRQAIGNQCRMHFRQTFTPHQIVGVS
jgi:hypothetical protein